jgi:hypothetical protein
MRRVPETRLHQTQSTVSGILDVKPSDWSVNGKLSGMALSKGLKSGQYSKSIWNSFQGLSLADQKVLLARKKNRYLSLYNDLFKHLNENSSATRLEIKQRNLAKLVTKAPSFISNQLQHDSELRKLFLSSLIDCQQPQYGILIEQIAQTPALASDFETLLSDIMNNNHNSSLNSLSNNLRLSDFFARSIALKSTIANTLLKYPDHFSAEFTTRIVLNRSGAAKVFRSNIASTLWQFNNALKLMLQYLFPAFADVFFKTPPLQYEIIEIMQKMPPDLKSAKETGAPRIPFKFNQFQADAVRPRTLEQERSLASDELPLTPQNTSHAVSPIPQTTKGFGNQTLDYSAECLTSTPLSNT